jgi:ABC-type transporter Mla subunit MlaD
MTRARIVAAAALVALLAGAAFAVGAGGSSSEHGYLVRAIFDNSSFIIPGEDVKVAGVTVGAVDSLDLTKDNKAVVVLKIDDPAFQSFKTDAHCRIALESLIGEQYVDCQATAGGADGRTAAALPAIASGPGKGQHLLDVDHTTTPVGVDLLNDIMRQPQAQRFRLIINELGAGLAGNGEDLRDALRRANPALQQADRVVAILADQNQVLGRLVDDSDTVLGPLAQRRKDLGGFIDTAGKTAVATAEQGDALEQDINKLPAFLAELKPAAQRFGALADQMTPAIRSLSAQAPAVNQAIKDLGPFSLSARPAVTSLGKVADRGRRTFPKIGGLVDSLNGLATPLQPTASDLAKVSGSFDQAAGFESLMRFIYYYGGSVNGEDAKGHLIRSTVDVNQCVARASQSDGSCAGTFVKPEGDDGATTARATSAKQATPQAAATAAATATTATSTLLDYLLGQDGQ